MGLSSLHYPLPVSSGFLERCSTHGPQVELVYVDFSTLCVTALGTQMTQKSDFLWWVTELDLNGLKKKKRKRKKVTKTFTFTKGIFLKSPVGARKNVLDNGQNIFQNARVQADLLLLPLYRILLLECFTICRSWKLALSRPEEENVVHVIQSLWLY